MPIAPPRTKSRRPKRYVRDESSKRIHTVVAAPKIEPVLVTPVERPNVFAYMEEEQVDETIPQPDQVDDKVQEEAVEGITVDGEAVNEEAEEAVVERTGDGDADEAKADADEATPQAPPYSNPSPTRPESVASEDSQRTRVEEYILQASSFHSDLGISMGSGSSEYDSPVLSYKIPQRSSACTKAGNVTAARPTRTTTFVNEEEDGMPGEEDDEEPEAFYASARRLPLDVSQSRRANAPRHFLPRSPRTETRGSRPAQGSTKKGYDLLASNISSNDTTVLKPLYRRFEAFNNRILLYLQDEITELEEELRELDIAIARESEATGNNTASRRDESRVPSQLQWRRLDLLGRSYTKIEQYSKLKTSMKTFAGYLVNNG